MLRTETVEAGTLALIKRLMADDRFNEFNLVGGTALALKVGHRISIDIDLFSPKAFNASELAEHLKTTYNVTQLRSITNGVFCFIDDIKIDLISHQYPLIGDIEISDGIRLVSPLDIGAMKLGAIYDNGTRLKDFVDLYALLENYTLDQLLEACQQKYQDINMPIVKNALLHHEDIEFSVPINYIGPEIKWAQITERLKKAFHNPHITFGLPEMTKKLVEKQQSIGKGKNKGPKL